MAQKHPLFKALSLVGAFLFMASAARGLPLPVEDDATKGTWVGKYGSDGYILPDWNGGDNPAGDIVKLPSYVSTWGWDAANRYRWQGPTLADVRAVQKPDASDRSAACFYDNTTRTLTINLNQAKSFELGVYCLDWDGGGGRSATLNVPGYAAQPVNTYNNGKWFIYAVSGDGSNPVTLSDAYIAGGNWVISAITFDPPPFSFSGTTLTWDGSVTDNWNNTPTPNHWTGGAVNQFPQVVGTTGDAAIVNSGICTVTGSQGAYSLALGLTGTLAIGAGASLNLQTTVTTTGTGLLTLGNGGQFIVGGGGSLLGVSVPSGTGTLNNGGPLTADHLTLGSGATFVSTGGGLTTFSQTAGSNTMNGTNTLQVNGGELRMNLSTGLATLGGAAVNLNGGTFGVSAAGAVNLSTSNVTVNASSTLNAVTSNGSVTYGSLTFGANNATLTTQNTTGGYIFSGGTGFANSGVTAVTFNTNSPTYPKVINDGGVARTITETGSSDLVLDTVPTSLISGTIFNVQSGRLVLIGNSTGTPPLGSASVQLNGGTLGLTTTNTGFSFNAYTTLTSSTLSAGAFYGGVANQTITLPTVNLPPAGQTLTLATANGYSFNIAGPTNGAAGNLTAGGTVNFNGPFSVAGTLTNSGTVGINAAMSGAGNVINSGNVTVSAPMNITGALTNSGTVNYTAAAPITGASSITNSGGTVSFNAPIVTSGPLNDTGGTTNLNVANPGFTGAASISGGTTNVNNVNALSKASSVAVTATGTLVANGTTLNLSVPLSVTAGGTFQMNPGASNTFSMPGSTINTSFATLWAKSGTADLTVSNLTLPGVKATFGPMTGQYYSNTVAGPILVADQTPAQANFDTFAHLTAFQAAQTGTVITAPLTVPIAFQNQGNQGISIWSSAAGSPDLGAPVDLIVSPQTWAVWTGTLTTTGPLTARFGTGSDDGSMIYINGNVVVNNNNFQGWGGIGNIQQTGLFTFPSAGVYNITTAFYQGGGGWGVQAVWDPTGGTNWTSIGPGVVGSVGNTFEADAGATLKIGTAFPNARAIILNGNSTSAGKMVVTPQALPAVSSVANMSVAGTNPLGILDLGTNNTLSVGALTVAAGGNLTVQNTQGGKGGTYLLDGLGTFGAGASMTVGSGVTLGGTGSLPGSALTLNSGATLAPGDPGVAGAFTITGDFTLPTGAILKVGVGPGGTSDKLVTTGNIAISLGAMLDAYAFGGAGFGTTDIVVDPGAASTVTGLFEALNGGGLLSNGSIFQGSDGNTFLIRYNQGPDGNEITLTDLVPEPCTLSLLALGALALLRRRRK